MKTFFWIYAVVGSFYYMMYSAGIEAVVKYAVGPFWLMMMLAPVTLGVLIMLLVARRLGLLNK